ncbi:hypothetical protein [Pelosinus propionicus]|uniref:Uncharacterized protein n=1 Tax=Pelosinus propionicus DSM 13327 TaxID=1123291 RepID=A0A1I4QC84_9FIRM|nr:hypothetical protein [Pelosinus propionicus]SFM37711.1 hypothetical protein SAMN04490355_109410 [Pelosinus propionicus DSM 13327]
MAINTLQYAALFQSWLDEAMVASATSNWMETNSGKIIYIGGREVKIPKLSMDGMGDYDPDNGYVQGAVTLEYQTKEMNQDRGRKFQIDRIQSDDTDFMATAYNVIEQFQRTRVVPEIDAYRYATIAALSQAAETADGDNGRYARSLTPTTSTIYTELQADIATIQDDVGEDYPLVITMSIATGNILNTANDMTRFLDSADFKVGNLQSKVKSINSIPIIFVPSARMYNSITLNDGTTTGQTTGGFSAATGAKKINWLITTRNAPIALSKADTVRIFDPMTNQKANAWAFDYRRYHDIWIPDNRMSGVFANIAAS